LLVTGSRDFADAALICGVLDRLLAEHGNLTVVHGAARGADTIADTWARQQISVGRDVRREPHPVTGLDWGRYGKAAGHRRNAEMVKAGADLVVGFFLAGALNKGTGGCCDLADAAGIEVRPYPAGAWSPKRKPAAQGSLDLGLYDVTINDGGH
jgi:hypothetical protein